MGIELIDKLFPDLTAVQKAQFASIKGQYQEWNKQINVISRKDIEHFDEHHLLHSLGLALYWKPLQGSRAIDIGTGGGFPGIPLAILYPEVEFLLVDSIGKKLKVAEDIAGNLGLKNVKVRHARAEEIKETYDVALSRAVARLETLVSWCTQGKLRVKKLYCLKGGDLRDEIEEIDRYPSAVYKLQDKFPTEYFESKKVVCVHFI